MDIKIQEEYLNQYRKRKKQEIFDKTSKPLLNEYWKLVDTYKTDSEHALKCEFPHPNGKTCGRRIKKIYTIQNSAGSLLKVGGTCLSYVVDIKKLEKVDKVVEKLKKKTQQVNRSYGNNSQKNYTDEEKTTLLQRAAQAGLIPEDVEELLKEGVPLPSGVYIEINNSLEILRRNQDWWEKNRQSGAQSGWDSISMELAMTERKRMAVQERLEALGPEHLDTVGDVKKGLELAVEAHLLLSKEYRLGIVKYSELIEPFITYYQLGEQGKVKLFTQFSGHVRDILEESYLIPVFDKGTSDFHIRFPEN